MNDLRGMANPNGRMNQCRPEIGLQVIAAPADPFLKFPQGAGDWTRAALEQPSGCLRSISSGGPIGSTDPLSGMPHAERPHCRPWSALPAAGGKSRSDLKQPRANAGVISMTCADDRAETAHSFRLMPCSPPFRRKLKKHLRARCHSVCRRSAVTVPPFTARGPSNRSCHRPVNVASHVSVSRSNLSIEGAVARLLPLDNYGCSPGAVEIPVLESVEDVKGSLVRQRQASRVAQPGVFGRRSGVLSAPENTRRAGSSRHFESSLAGERVHAQSFPISLFLRSSTSRGLRSN
jgi:hypothetical protein